MHLDFTTRIIAIALIILIAAIAYDNRKARKKREDKILYVPNGGLIGQIVYISKLIKYAQDRSDLIKVHAGIKHLSVFFHDDPEIEETCLRLRKMAWDKEMELLIDSLNEPQQV